MSPARFRWGLLFVLVGGVLLLNNIDVIDWWVWSDILSLWPLILIAIGLEKIFTRSRVEFIAYLPIVVLAGIVVWVAFDKGGGDDFFTRRGSRHLINIGMEPEFKRIEAEFHLDDIDISLNDITGNLFRTRSDRRHRIPEVEFDEENGVANLNLFPQRKKLPNWIRIDGWERSGDWDVYLSDQIPINLACYGDESDMTLDCRDLFLENLSIESDDGNNIIRIGTLVPSLKVKLEGRRGDFRLDVPAGSGIRISGGDEGISRYLDRAGLVASGEYYISDGYDTLSPKIEIDLSSDVKKLALDYY